MSGAGPTFKIYPTEPHPSLFRELEAHVSATGQPETFPGVHPGPLARDEEFRRLGKVELDPLKRPEGDRAPCPMCHSPNKFKAGWFVYLPRLQAVATIGNECAGKDTRISADAAWRERQTKLTQENYLEAAIPQLGRWLSVIEATTPIADAAEGLLKGFRSTGKTYFKALTPARSSDGRLFITEEVATAVGPVGMRTSGSSNNTRDVLVGTIRGLKALDPRFCPYRSLVQIRDLIVRHACPTEEATLDYITGPEAQRRTAYKDLRKAQDALGSLLLDLADCRSFFTEDNAAVIAEWASQPETAIQFKLGLTPTNGGCRFFFYRPGDFWNPLVPDVLWEPIPSLQQPPEALAA